MINKLIILILCFLMGALSAKELKPPKYTDYPVVSRYAGKAAPVILQKDDMNFRTRIRYAAKQPINFAGEYTLSLWGCGASCLMGVIVSKKTGKVFWLPGSICCWKGEGDNILFKENSRLLITAGVMNEESEHGAHFYEFTGKKFKHLRTIPVEPIVFNSLD